MGRCQGRGSEYASELVESGREAGTKGGVQLAEMNFQTRSKVERREKGCFGLKVTRRSTLLIKKYLFLVFFPAVWQVV